MELSKDIISEIIKRAQHESLPFIAQLLGISQYSVEKVVHEYNVEKLPLDERIESLEYIAYRCNIDLEYLNAIVYLANKYRMPIPKNISDNAISKIKNHIGKTMSYQSWNFLRERVTLQDLDYILENYSKYTNNTIIRDLKIENSKGLMPRIATIYELSKPERENLYCEICRVEHLPPKGYKSNTSCKSCWSKRMSDYQYIYYPQKKAKENA